MEKLPELSVFFPAYNEEKNIKETVSKATKILPKIASKYEIIIVDDGSTDKTGEIADKIAKDNKSVRVVHHHPNRGYGAALKSGFSKSRYSWVAFTDADGQFDFSEIENFLPLTRKADLILGYRIKRADSIVRRIYTFGWFAIARLLLGLDVKDYSCGFKLIKKEVFEAVQPLEGEEKVTQIELLVKAERLGFKFAEVGVSHYPRKFGQQTGANLKVVAKSIIDLVKLWQKLR
ncbi:MAG: glycosyltransferase family 2 protein [Patescibacteria group bacterium]